MEENLKISNVKYLRNHWSDLPQILNLNLEDQTKINNLLWNTASNNKSWISQQQLIRSTLNLELKQRGPNLNKKCLKWRWPPKEANLKISKVEYLSNHCSDLLQIFNLNLEAQTKNKNAWNEDNLWWKRTSKY